MKCAMKALGIGMLLATWFVTGCQDDGQATVQPRKNQQLPVVAAHIQGDLTYQDVLQNGELVHAVGMPGQAGQVWVGTHRGLYVSAQNKTWALLSPDLGGEDIAGWVVNANNPNEVFVAGESVSFRSTDGGKSWEQVGDGLPPSPDIRSVVEAMEGNQRVIYALVATEGVFRSVDGGLHWKKYMALEQPVNSMEYNAADGHLYVVTQDGVLVNDGMNWVKEDLPGASQVYSVAADNTKGDLYASTSQGIFQKRNGAWKLMSANAPERLVVIAAGSDKNSLIGVGESALLYVLQQEGWKKWE
ncbi:UNVERIFIED_CONTAM: ligand-binding sensor domain-containing protein [Brevibacillus sp. OAP136]